MSSESSSEDSELAAEEEHDSSDKENQPKPMTVRRSERGNRGVPPDRYMGITKLTTLLKEDPRTRDAALSGPDKENLKKAMNEEIDSLSENETWETVPEPKGANVVSCKWVFKTKQNADGTTDRYKARLVARGFSQK